MLNCEIVVFCCGGGAWCYPILTRYDNTLLPVDCDELLFTFIYKRLSVFYIFFAQYLRKFSRNKTLKTSSFVLKKTEIENLEKWRLPNTISQLFQIIPNGVSLLWAKQLPEKNIRKVLCVFWLIKINLPRH